MKILKPINVIVITVILLTGAIVLINLLDTTSPVIAADIAIDAVNGGAAQVQQLQLIQNNKSLVNDSLLYLIWIILVGSLISFLWSLCPKKGTVDENSTIVK